MTRHILISLLTCLLSACKSPKVEEDGTRDSIFPEKIYEGDEVVILAIDSLLGVNTNTDSLFFKYHIGMQNTVNYKEGIVRFSEGEGKLKIPQGSAYISGNFYTLDSYDDFTHVVKVRFKRTDKFVPNAYGYYRTNDRFLERELESNPDNLLAYSQALIGIAENYDIGKISDTVMFDSAKKYLEIVEQKAKPENARDLQALVALYAFNNKFRNARKIVSTLYEKYPMSYEFVGGFKDYRWAEFVLRQDSSDFRKFVNSLERKVAENHPVSPFGKFSVDFAHIDDALDLYEDEDIIENLEKYAQMRTDDVFVYEAKMKVFLRMGDIEKAREEAFKYMEAVKNNQFIHYSPIRLSNNGISLEKMPTQKGWVYTSFARVEQAEGSIEKSIAYLDSAYMFFIQDESYVFKNDQIEKALNQKSQLQQQLGRYDEALQTYETLYEETEKPAVLDSIQVLFKEMEQEKGFKTYAKELKERVANNEEKQAKELAPDFSIKDMSGYEIKLSEWKDRTVVINFWANYCLPCAKEIPHLNKLWRSTQTEDVIFLAATKNTKLEVERFAQRQKEMFGFVILPEAEVLFEAYDVNLVPTTIVINQKGEIIHREVGFSKDKNIKELEQVIRRELENKSEKKSFHSAG